MQEIEANFGLRRKRRWYLSIAPKDHEALDPSLGKAKAGEETRRASGNASRGGGEAFGTFQG